MSKSEVEKLNKYLASRENELTIKLAGRKIKSVRILSKEEAHGLGWEKRPLVLQLDNGALLYSMQDDEGNDGGSLSFEHKGICETIAVRSVWD